MRPPTFLPPNSWWCSRTHSGVGWSGSKRATSAAEMNLTWLVGVKLVSPTGITSQWATSRAEDGLHVEYALAGRWCQRPYCSMVRIATPMISCT